MQIGLYSNENFLKQELVICLVRTSEFCKSVVMCSVQIITHILDEILVICIHITGTRFL